MLSVESWTRRCRSRPTGARPATSPWRAKPGLPGLLACRRGAYAVEFAFAAPILIVAVLGIFEIARVLTVSSLMEGGLRDAARYGITGFVAAGTTREQAIRKIIDDHTLGIVDMQKVQISTLVYPSFGDIGKPEPFVDDNGNGVFDAGEPFTDVNGNGEWDSDMGVDDPGGAGDIVLYRIAYDLPLLTPYLAGVIGTDGAIRLVSSIPVRNEPFGAGGGG